MTCYHCDRNGAAGFRGIPLCARCLPEPVPAPPEPEPVPTFGNHNEVNCVKRARAEAYALAEPPALTSPWYTSIYVNTVDTTTRTIVGYFNLAT